MFAYLRGAVASTGSNYVVLDVGGIGFRVMTSWQTLQRLPTPGEFCTLYTHFSVRDDAMELFGFDTETELECYEMLTAVTGVGPRVALAILSEFSSDQFALAVASKDAKRLTVANGVGAKLAQRIVMELSDKMTGERFFVHGQDDAPVPARTADSADEAVSALVVLGYSQAEALCAVRSIDTQGLSVEETIKTALKSLMRQ